MRTLIATGLLALGLTGTVPALEEASPKEPSVAELDLVAALHEVRTQAFDLGEVPPELERRIVGALELDGDLLAEMLGTLADRRIPAAGELPAQRLSIVQEELLLDALGQLSSRAVADARDQWLASFESDEEGAQPVPRHVQDAAIRVTGATGLASDLCLLFELAPDQARPGGPLELALVDLMRADPRSLDRMRDCWFGAGPGRLPACMAAVATVGDPRALAFLEDVVRWSDETQLAAIAVVRVLGRGLDPQVNQDLGVVLTDLLATADPATRQAAADALAALGHQAAIPALIDQLDLDAELEPEAPAIAGAAHRALRTLTGGMGLPVDAGLWRRWYEDEQEWLRRGADDELRRLSSETPAEVVAALGVLGRHRLGAEQLAPRLEPLLDHAEPMVVTQACRLLAGYRNLATVSPLLDLLGSDDAGLRTEAWLALTAITGLALPEDAMVWRRELPLELQ